LCEKAGVKAPRSIVRVDEAKADLLASRIVIGAAVIFGAFVAVVPMAQGARFGGKATLLAAAVVIAFVGAVQAASAKRRLRHRRDS
jgi:VIT1/CCC1 family predicted Fe2+/Mn2+ transporter